MNYYRRYWDESTGEELTDSWETSNYYFETDKNMNILRQIQVFENSNALKYSEDFVQDEFGMLSDQNLDEEDFKDCIISSNEFEKVWNESNHYKQKTKWWKFW